MKKKEIAKHLDEVADSIAHAKVSLVPINDETPVGDELPLSDAELVAIKVGAMSALSYASLLCEGSLDTIGSANSRAAQMIGIAAEHIIERRKDESHE